MNNDGKIALVMMGVALTVICASTVYFQRKISKSF